MFNRKKAEEKEKREKREKERLARKLLGKDSGRRVFGFKCDPDIPADLKSTSDKMHIPEYSLAEHALELGMMQIKKAIDDPEEREELRRHITEVHVGNRTVEKVSRYDEEAANDLRNERIHRFAIDKTVRQIVLKFVQRGMNLKYIAGYLEYGYRCFMAYVNNQPFPKPTRSMFQQ